MKHAQDMIRSMRKDVDDLARRDGRLVEVTKPDHIVILRADTIRGFVNLKIQKLTPGMRLKTGDLWCSDAGQLCRIDLPWWMAWSRKIRANEGPYYRVLN